jgi:hypothetical protein
MPASLYGDMDHHHGGGGLSLHHHLPSSTPVLSVNTNCSSGGIGGGSLIDNDQRTLQLALELSMLGLSDGTSLGSLHQLAASMGGNDHHGLGGHNALNNLNLNMHHHQQQQHQQHHNQMQHSPSDIYSMAHASDLLPKKSQNMTECVPVPSSEFVAEIVGRRKFFFPNFKHHS